MKKQKTPLDFAQQLEDFQTTRKAKEVNEIYTFDRLKESLKQRLLTLDRRMEKLRRKSLRHKIDNPELPEEQSIREQAQTLEELVQFDQQAYDAHINAPDNEFDTIADMQGFRYQNHADHKRARQQLPEAHVDAFAHELDALTEHELQKELEQNRKNLRESLKKPGRLELSPEPLLKDPEIQAAPDEAQEREELEAQEPLLRAEPETQKNATQENVPAKKTSGSSPIYFRSTLPPSDE